MPPSIQIAGCNHDGSLCSSYATSPDRRVKHFTIVSEILDVRNRDLAEVTSADDVIVSERLVALALAQIAENKAAVPVFVEFLNPGGVEIYLKPAQDYVAIGKPVTFYTVLEAARRKRQTHDRLPVARRGQARRSGRSGYT